MRVALTGADGFTGRYVAEALTAAGATCVALSADLLDGAAIDRAVAETDLDRVIHLAAKAFVGDADWVSFYQVNQLGTYRLLDAIARHRPGARVIIASSAQVYGPGATGLIAEGAPTRPANHYALSKLAAEWGAARWNDRLQLAVTRPFNYTGVGQGDEYLIPKIVAHFRRRTERIELGNTWVQRDFGDVRSVASAYAGLVLADEIPDVINLATGRVSSIGDIVQILEGLSGHRMDVAVNPAFVRANDVPVLGGDIARLRATLPHWEARTLEDTLAWMYNNERTSE
ncbi:UDP-glucose 4-epimerase [Sphingomonas guangdongensis]|uniref:UDP-glucose 4-epimerase n=1 Tax=Sphingomonas guangdongensis TaxID=1141890 RepID=A0A285QGJ5_9SPHN|nr:GDP-mannose 4,6-dehydratase [Sphingomonas guangdongensis]SOB80594.1 UDP-glucose 4-epimerase [Sphingomonas guangdongensis]